MKADAEENKNGDGNRRNVIEINTDKKCARCGGNGATSATGVCLDCVSRNLRFDVPRQNEFLNEGADFLEAAPVAVIGRKLIKKYDEDFGDIRNAEIIYLWKKKGGSGGGKNVLGKCQKPSGLLSHFTEADYIIWLAADNCLGLTEFQITALVFHELKHAFYNKQENKYETRSHDFEGFGKEVEIFGNWKSDITAMGASFKRAEQLKLFV